MRAPARSNAKHNGPPTCFNPTGAIILLKKPLEIQLQRAITQAMAMTESRIKQHPKYNPLLFAKIQLELIQTLLEQPRAISTESIAGIKIGLMAIKEFEDDAPDYADALCRVCSLVKKIALANDNRAS
jgi:hypothetical protein